MNKIPFISNSPDDLHCLQSAYLSIAKYFLPTFDPDWYDWSKLTGFEPSKGTWASAGLLWFYNQKFKVSHISLFDYERFIETGGQYLIELVGEEVGKWQIEHTNIAQEQARAKELLRYGIVEKREPNLLDIKNLLDRGYLVRVLINSRAINNKPGYSGHAVTVFSIDEENIIYHDPGLPPIPSRKVPISLFEKAWAYPSKNNKELDAIKL